MSLLDRTVTYWEHLKDNTLASPEACLDAAQKIATAEYIQHNKPQRGAGGGAASRPDDGRRGECRECRRETRPDKNGKIWPTCYPCAQKIREARENPRPQYRVDEEPF